MNRTNTMQSYTVKDMKVQLRAGQFAFPGGYPLYFLTSDGEALSFEAVRSQFKQVCQSIKHRYQDGWQVVACDVNWEDGDLTCAHTGKRIESAYAD